VVVAHDVSEDQDGDCEAEGYQRECLVGEDVWEFVRARWLRVFLSGWEHCVAGGIC
jgi:hypothetical protein